MLPVIHVLPKRKYTRKQPINVQPTVQHTVQPTVQPTVQHTVQPTDQLVNVQLLEQPTVQPLEQPLEQPVVPIKRKYTRKPKIITSEIKTVTPPSDILTVQTIVPIEPTFIINKIIYNDNWKKNIQISPCYNCNNNYKIGKCKFCKQSICSKCTKSSQHNKNNLACLHCYKLHSLNILEIKRFI
jgi:hypothetical protein